MRHAFEAALDEAGRAKPEEAPGPPVVRFTPELSSAPAGHHLLWETAAAWTPEADPPPLEPPAAAPARPSAEPGDIANELGLAELKTPADVARARRRFMWANHPDRRADLDHDLANSRVAVANMLLDRVQWLVARTRAR